MIGLECVNRCYMWFGIWIEAYRDPFLVLMFHMLWWWFDYLKARGWFTLRAWFYTNILLGNGNRMLNCINDFILNDWWAMVFRFRGEDVSFFVVLVLRSFLVCLRSRKRKYVFFLRWEVSLRRFSANILSETRGFIFILFFYNLKKYWWFWVLLMRLFLRVSVFANFHFSPWDGFICGV